MIRRLSWIDRDKLLTFILSCQNKTTGGFSDRPGHGVDPFHTLFGIAGISLLVHNGNQTNSNSSDHQVNSSANSIDLDELRKLVKPINPVLCMPEDVIAKLNVKMQLLTI